MTIDKDKLRVLAEAVIEIQKTEDRPIGDAWDAFESAANPATILALLAEIEHAWREAGNECKDWAREVERRQEVQRERDQLKAERDRLQSQVATLQADPGSWQSGYDAGRKSMAGHADSWRKEADGLRKDARRWKCVRNAIPMQSPYAVWREGSHVVLGKDADELIDNFLSAKEKGHD